MNDLISRSIIVSVIDAELAGELSPVFADGLRRARDLISVEPPITPRVVVNITGGVPQGASADHPIEVHTLDFEVDSFDSDTFGILVGGDEAYHGCMDAEIDPTFIEEVANAETIYFASGEPADA